MSLLQSSAELLQRSQAERMRLWGTFFLDPQAICSMIVRYCSTIMMMCSSWMKYFLSRLILLPTVYPTEKATLASISRYLRSFLRSLSCQRHQRVQWSAWSCRRYVATRRYPCREERVSTLSSGRPWGLMIPLRRRQIGFLDGSEVWQLRWLHYFLLVLP